MVKNLSVKAKIQTVKASHHESRKLQVAIILMI